MDPSLEQSVSMWIKDVREGDQDAARKIWERYFDRLVKSAGWKMRDMARRDSDEEDIAVSVFNSLYRGAQAGRFEQMTTRDDLWRLMIAIASHKIFDQVRRQTSQKRGGGQVRGESLFHGVPGNDSPAGFEMFADENPSPEFLTALEEEHSRLFGKLRDDTQREIA